MSSSEYQLSSNSSFVKIQFLENEINYLSRERLLESSRDLSRDRRLDEVTSRAFGGSSRRLVRLGSRDCDFSLTLLVKSTFTISGFFFSPGSV